MTLKDRLLDEAQRNRLIREACDRIDDLEEALRKMVRAHDDMADAGFGVKEDADHAREVLREGKEL